MKGQILYRLIVQYPPEAYYPAEMSMGDALDPDWEPEGWRQLMPEDWHGDEFAWPKNKLYWSKSGAEARADLFRKYGAIVTVVKSNPITWTDPAPRIRLARCMNDDFETGRACDGFLTFIPGDRDAGCSVCSARCGVLGADYIDGLGPTQEAREQFAQEVAKAWAEDHAAGHPKGPGGCPCNGGGL